MARSRVHKLILILCLLLPSLAMAQPEVDALRLYLGTSGSACVQHSGTGAPATGLGAVCDTYHRKDSPYTIYVKTAGSTWTAIVRLPGDTGITTVGALDAGSITSNFGSINVGADSIQGGTITATTAVSTPQLTYGSGNLLINPSGDITFNPTGNDLLPITNYDLNIGSLFTKFLTLHVGELWVENLVAQDTIATIGGRILVGPTTTLVSDLSSGATSIVVKHNQMVSGDRIVMQGTSAVIAGVPQVEWMAVTSGASGSAGSYTYSVTRNLDGSGANTWVAGDAVFNTGTTGDGYVDLYSINGLLPGSTAGPTIVGNVRTGTTYSQVEPRWAIGNLNGLYGYSSEIYGAAFGDSNNAWLKTDPSNGIAIGEGANVYFQVDPAGNATFAGNVTVGSGANILSNTEFRRATTAVNGTWTGGGTCSGGGAGNSRCFGWQMDTDSGTSWSHACNLAGWTPTNGGMCFGTSGGAPANGTYVRFWGPSVAVVGSAEYECSIYLGLHRIGGGTGGARCRMIWYDNADNYLGETDATGGANAVDGGGQGGPDMDSWQRAWGFLTAPSNASTGVVTIISYQNGSEGGNPYIMYTRPMLRQVEAGRAAKCAAAAAVTMPCQPTHWSPGGETLISGDMLMTDLVISNTMRSTGATAFGTGTGYWLDATGTPTFRVGNPAGNRLSWDGTNVVLGQSTLTIDSTGIILAPSSLSSWVAANAFRFSSAASHTMGTFGYEASSVSGLKIFSSGTTNASQIDMTASNSTSAAQIVVGVNIPGGTATGAIELVANSSGAYTGAIGIGGIPNFRGSSAGSAGSLAGYINIQVSGTAFKIPVYNP